MNVRILKRKLHQYGLRRRNKGHSEHTVREIVNVHLPSSARSFDLFCRFARVYEGHFMLCNKEEF